MSKSELLIKAYELIQKSDVFHDKMELEWVSDLMYMYDQGWLYGALKDGELLAVAGAYRIAEWDEKYRYQLPREEEGNILFVSFCVSQANSMTVPLKMLNAYLRENPSIHELVYFKKGWGVYKRHFRVGRQETNHDLVHQVEMDSIENPMVRHVTVAPPELAEAV